MVPKTAEDKLKCFQTALTYCKEHPDDPTALFAVLVIYSKIISGTERVDLADVAKIISRTFKLETKVAATLKLLENFQL